MSEPREWVLRGSKIFHHAAINGPVIDFMDEITVREVQPMDPQTVADLETVDCIISTNGYMDDQEAWGRLRKRLGAV